LEHFKLGKYKKNNSKNGMINLAKEDEPMEEDESFKIGQIVESFNKK